MGKLHNSNFYKQIQTRAPACTHTRIQRRNTKNKRNKEYIDDIVTINSNVLEMSLMKNNTEGIKRVGVEIPTDYFVLIPCNVFF